MQELMWLLIVVESYLHILLSIYIQAEPYVVTKTL